MRADALALARGSVEMERRRGAMVTNPPVRWIRDHSGREVARRRYVIPKAPVRCFRDQSTPSGWSFAPDRAEHRADPRRDRPGRTHHSRPRQCRLLTVSLGGGRKVPSPRRRSRRRRELDEDVRPGRCAPATARGIAPPRQRTARSAGGSTATGWRGSTSHCALPVVQVWGLAAAPPAPPTDHCIRARIPSRALRLNRARSRFSVTLSCPPASSRESGQHPRRSHRQAPPPRPT
jgi:hypothetical protein